MVIWFVLLGIAVAAIALMVIPLWRRTDGGQPRAAFDAQVYRDQLTELELDAERGRIAPDQAASARTEIARRLLATESGDMAGEQTSGRLTTDGAAAVSHAARRGISVFVAIAVPIASFGVYMIVGSPHLPARPAAQMAAQMQAQRAAAQPASEDHGAALVAQLAGQLKERPNDLRGWTLYARSLVRLGRYDDAVAAYSRVTALAPRDAELMSRMAETQILAADGLVTPAAHASLQATLALDATEPRARYYLGLADSQAGKLDAALTTWIALEADSPPNAPWRAILADRIAKLADQTNIPADQLAARRKTAAASATIIAAPAERTTQQPPGPSAEDVKAAQSMSPKDRMAMIRGMVDGLAERLKNEPNDIQGWQQLARSYDVLGETLKARDARARVAQLQNSRARPTPPRGPSAEDVKAAQSMSPTDRMAMIRGMVDGLAERLKNEPNDIQGWQQLARSYGVLGEAAKARDAYGRLAELQPDNVTALTDYARAIARTLAKDAAIPAELVALGDRILGLDPRHTGALWFTGMARAKAGDTDGARERWTRLLAELDPNSPQHADVKKSIEALDKTGP